MKYIAVEGMSKEDLLKAGKARVDALEIAKTAGFKPLNISTVQGIRYKKWQKPVQFYLYRKNQKTWEKILSELKADDSLIIQYPLINTTLNFEEVIKKYSKKVKIIVLIHDLESIRYKGGGARSKVFLERVEKSDAGVLKSAYRVISHNEKMSIELKKLGVGASKIINLGVFDYLNEKQKAKVSFNKRIVIAGNLAPEKSRYLEKIKNLESVQFNLYGINFSEKCRGKNIDYKGVFKPDELISELEGSFGLVWDGDSLKSCTGQYGNYLRYNNPHKLSLYLSAGLPVIVWDKSALAEFVKENEIGITISSLEELPEKLKEISEKDYESILKSVKKISKKVSSGEYLRGGVSKMEKSPLACVIMATYNGEKYLREQLDSIIAQSYTNWILYVSDDGSKDKTIDILKEYQKKLGKNKLIFSKNPRDKHGAKYNFCYAIDTAPKADYYFFSDQDDVWDKDKMKLQIKEAEKLSGQALVYCDAKIVDENLKPLGKETLSERFTKMPKKHTLERSLFVNRVAGCTMCINYELLEASRKLQPEEICMHDFYILLSALAFGEVKFLDKTLNFYRQHENNVVGAKQVNSSLKQKIFKMFDKKLHQEWHEDNWQHYRQARHLLERNPGKDLKIIQKFLKIAEFKSGIHRIFSLEINHFRTKDWWTIIEKGF